MVYMGTKRKVFISFHQGDRAEVDNFIKKWADVEKVFIPKSLGTSNNDDFINSENTDYVMNQIRSRYLGDSTVTIVLLGTCTHSRRYVDWEIKSSLRQGNDELPNGLLGILLPSMTSGSCHLPQRFKENWNTDSNKSYARYYRAPSSAEQLGGWIEDAFQARTSRTNLIKNSQEMMKYNAKCEVHSVTH